MTNRNKQSIHLEIGGFEGLYVLQLQSSITGLFRSHDMVHNGVPDELNLWIAECAILHDL